MQEAGDVDGLNKLLLNKRKERKALSEDVKYIIESIKGINISGSGVFTLVIVFRGIEYKVEVEMERQPFALCARRGWHSTSQRFRLWASIAPT